MSYVTAYFGPPGTGKTTFLCTRVMPWVHEKYYGMPTAVLSFSRAAARKLTSRLQPVPSLYVGTIHSLCFHELGLSKSDVATPEKFADMHGVDVNVAYIVTNTDSLARNIEGDPKDVYSKTMFNYNDVITMDSFEFYLNLYKEWKEKGAYLDFTDILEEATRLGVLYKVGFRAVVVDESQDLTPLQWKTITAMDAEQIILAGDDDQSIYTFNGADPAIMVNESQSKFILNQSYRCPRRIHEAANKVVNKISSRQKKSWLPRPVDGVLDMFGSYEHAFHNVPAPHLVLVRDRWRMSEVIDFLTMLAVPFRIAGGRSAFESRHAKVIRAVANKDYEYLDDSLGFMNPLMTMRVQARKLDGSEKKEDVINWEKIDYNEGKYLLNVDLNSKEIVTVSTIHGFKGEEADRVVLDCNCTIRVENAQFSDDLDSELRVWYVGITRAKESLYMIGDNSFIRE